MTAGTPKNEAPQPEQTDYPVTIERIDLPDDLPQDDRSGSYAPVVPQMSPTTSTSVRLSKMDKSLPTPTLRPLLLGEVLAVLNGTLTIPPDAVFETAEETAARLKISRQAEAQRLKERLSPIPWHAKRAAKEGDAYWLRLAQSYQGD